jgi:hypothetical protein
MWSASMGAPRSMSRNMEAVSPEPSVVKTARFSSMKRLLGGKALPGCDRGAFIKEADGQVGSSASHDVTNGGTN